MEEERHTNHNHNPKPNPEILQALEALKRASKEVEVIATTSDDGGCSSPSMRALLELETGSDDLFSGDPLLSPLRHLLSKLRSLSSSLPSTPPNKSIGTSFLNSIFRRPKSPHHAMVSRVAGSISAEIQSWIDRETLHRLVSALGSQFSDEERATLLLALETRASEGFDRGFQDTLLKSGAFSVVESALAEPGCAKVVRDRCAALIYALVRFNKDVFVGPVLMGSTIDSLVTIASPATLQALNGLIAAIKSPLIDELHSRGELQRLVSLLSSPDLEVQIRALEFALAIGYFGRKEAVEAMLAQGLIKRLLCLQRSELGGALIEMDSWDFPKEIGRNSDHGIRVGRLLKPKQGKSKQLLFLEARPFASAVARFAIQVEVGEGLRQREKRAIKQDILKRVKEAATSPVEAANVFAEVLWGSTP
ncbi:hypothetical protein LUZ62_043838 [Rhynchospora pubera]|uniref:Uncharacterized protein n=1 Tax=Rhynchospora pubera TaxID=906938 RepID=A0AAV8FGY2_9POAL|nr:hypothetical protein LUZ62_043838 [Rhynchospora pubera]